MCIPTSPNMGGPAGTWSAGAPLYWPTALPCSIEISAALLRGLFAPDDVSAYDSRRPLSPGLRPHGPATQPDERSQQRQGMQQQWLGNSSPYRSGGPARSSPQQCTMEHAPCTARRGTARTTRVGQIPHANGTRLARVPCGECNLGSAQCGEAQSLAHSRAGDAIQAHALNPSRAWHMTYPRLLERTPRARKGATLCQVAYGPRGHVDADKPRRGPRRQGPVFVHTDAGYAGRACNGPVRRSLVEMHWQQGPGMKPWEARAPRPHARDRKGVHLAPVSDVTSGRVALAWQKDQAMVLRPRTGLSTSSMRRTLLGQFAGPPAVAAGAHLGEEYEGGGVVLKE